MELFSVPSNHLDIADQDRIRELLAGDRTESRRENLAGGTQDFYLPSSFPLVPIHWQTHGTFTKSKPLNLELLSIGELQTVIQGTELPV